MCSGVAHGVACTQPGPWHAIEHARAGRVELQVLRDVLLLQGDGSTEAELLFGFARVVVLGTYDAWGHGGYGHSGWGHRGGVTGGVVKGGAVRVWSKSGGPCTRAHCSVLHM